MRSFAGQNHTVFMAQPAPLSCYLLTFNSEKYLPQILAALQPIADDLVLVDSGSTDGTAQIAEKYGARFIYRKFDNFKNQRNFAQDQCQHSWVFNLDSDEVPTAACIEAIAELKAKNFETETNGPDAYRIERHWYYWAGKCIASTPSIARIFRCG